jgi:hypothetical protein
MLRKTRLYLWRNGISPLALLFVVALIGLSVFLPHNAHGLSVLGTAFPLGAGMILDAQTTLSDFQALAASGASTNLIDFTKVRNLGVGEPLALVLTLDVAADATDGNETYTAQLQTDTTAAFGAAGQRRSGHHDHSWRRGRKEIHDPAPQRRLVQAVRPAELHAGWNDSERHPDCGNRPRVRCAERRHDLPVGLRHLELITARAIR